MAAIIVAVAVAACSATRPASDASPTVGSAGDRPIPLAVADLPLVDDQGASTTLSALRGKTIVLTDFLTLCQEICPLTSANLLQVQEAIGRAGRADQIVIVDVTVDPARDTPARLAAYRTIVGAGSNWKFLTGSAATIQALWKWFGIAYETTPEDSPAPIDWWTGKPLTYDVGHSDALFFIDSHGSQRYVVAGPPNASSAQIPSGLASFLNADGRANLASQAADSWTAADVDTVLSWLTHHQIPAT